MKTVFLKFLCDSFTGQGAPGDKTRANSNTWTRIPAVTNLAAVRGERVLCIVDGDNWNISARNRRLRIRYEVLLEKLRAVARQVFPVVVITSNPGDDRCSDALVRAGWRVVSIPRETILTRNGIEKVSNADADLCFELGVLSGVADCTAVIVGTGDGNLAISCSAGLRRAYRKAPLRVHTLSFAGATSERLRTRRDLFASSSLLGLDLLVPEPFQARKRGVYER